MSKYTENALSIYEKLYYNNGETIPDQVHQRVAKSISNNDDEYDNFLYMLDNFIFRPNTPCMVNAKIFDENNPRENYKNSDLNLCACFVLNLEDSMDSIREMWSTCSKVYEGAGGCGIPLSHLREKNSIISSGGMSSGALSFLNVVQSISNTVRSGGKSRRAANLVSFKYNHPDILEYINIKSKKDGSLNAINTSILMYDSFMSDVDNKNWDKNIKLVSPTSGKITGKITVKELWDNIIEQSWFSGDPGLIFYDTVNKTHSFPNTHKVVAANPCGEVMLQGNSACVLGHINLNKCIENNEFNFEIFKKYIRYSRKFLDNVIDKTSFPNEKFEITMKRDRPIGIGHMGLADIFLKLGIRYGSQDSLDLYTEICKAQTVTAIEDSIDSCFIDKQQPIDIPEQDYDHFVNRLQYFAVSEEYIEKFKKSGIRNSTVTTVAPTGCLTGNTFVLTSDGILYFNEIGKQFIKKNIEKKWYDNTLTVLQENNITESNKFFFNEISNNNKIITKDGYEICGTDQHQIRIIDNNGNYIWKHLNNINLNDLIPIRVGGHEELLKNKKYVKLNNLNKKTINKDFIQPDVLDEKLAFIIGYFMGSVDYSNLNIKASIPNKNFDIQSVIKYGMKLIFGLEPYIESKDNDVIYEYIDDDLKSFFKNNGFLKKKHPDQKHLNIPHIPLLIRKSKSSVLCSFLQGLFETNETIHKSNNYIINPIINIETKFISFSKEIQQILLILGMTTTIDNLNNLSSFYKIRFKTDNDLLIFKDKIGYISQYKLDILNQISYKNKEINIESKIIWESFFSLIPNIKEEYIQQKNNILQNGIGPISFAKKIKNEYPIVKDTTLIELINKNLILSSIENIEKNIDLTMDLHVPNDNYYIANGFVSHNSTSISCNEVSYAFEPLFALIWTKHLVDGSKMLFINEEFKIACKKHNINLNETMLKKIQNNKGSCQNIDEIPEEIRNVFVTAFDISWKNKIDMQSSGQRYITLAISSTCNLPSSATKQDIQEAYLYAWKKDLKGITVYRDGCLDTQPVEFGKTDDLLNQDVTSLNRIKRPVKRNGITLEINTPHGKLFLTGNKTEKNKLFEMFIRLGQQGHITNIAFDALGRVISKALQFNIPPEEIVRTLHDCGGFNFYFRLDDDCESMEPCNSVVDAIAKIIDYHFNDNKSNIIESIVVQQNLKKCPECGSISLDSVTGCRGGTCLNPKCGYSKCG